MVCCIGSNGKTLAIGAIYNDGVNGQDTGHVRVYEIEETLNITNLTVFEQLGDDIDGEAAHDQSGFSVATNSDGSIIAIGAPYNDGTADNAGHVRVSNGRVTRGASWVPILTARRRTTIVATPSL